MKNTGAIAFDWECTKLPNSFPWCVGGYAVCFAIAREDGTTKAWLLNHPECRQSHAQSISEIKQELDNATRIVAHNAKFDLLWLMHYGIDISKYKVFCTQVAEYLLRGQQGGRGELTLEQLSKDYGISDKIDKVKVFWESGYETDEIPADILLPYCEQDCINALVLYQQQCNKLVSQNLVALSTLQFELCKVLATIEYNGMKVDRTLAESYGEEYGRKLSNIDREIHELLGTEIGIDTNSLNLNSKDQLSAILYGGYIREEGQELVEKPRKDGSIRSYFRKCVSNVRIEGLGFRPSAETSKEGVYSTDAEALKSLKCTTPAQKRILELFQEKAKLSKLKSTYFDGIVERLCPDDTVHPSMNNCITRTGRLSSSNPNGQNMPRGNTGPVKRIFISRY